HLPRSAVTVRTIAGAGRADHVVRLAPARPPVRASLLRPDVDGDPRRRRRRVPAPGQLRPAPDRSLPHKHRDVIMTNKILIIDYGMANLRSVQKAFEKVGCAAEISSDPNRIGGCDKLVLPGVGAFRDAIARVNEAGLAGPIKEHIARGKKFLG